MERRRSDGRIRGCDRHRLWRARSGDSLLPGKAGRPPRDRWPWMLAEPEPEQQDCRRDYAAPAELSVCPLEIMVTIDAVDAWDLHARNEAHRLRTERLKQLERPDRERNYSA